MTVSGFIYNLGLLAGSWFEGQMTGCRVNILRGSSQFKDILPLVFLYVGAITYLVSGRESNRKNAYEAHLDRYEKAAVKANI